MASPLGATITIEAKMVNVDGRKIDYVKYKRSKMVNQLEKVVHQSFSG